MDNASDLHMAAEAFVNTDHSNQPMAVADHEMAEMRPMPSHWQGITFELAWLRQLLAMRIDSYFNDQHFDFTELPPPNLPGLTNANSDCDGCYYAGFILKQQLTATERLLLIVAWAAEFFPDELDTLQTRNKLYDLPYVEFGGWHNQNQPGFCPTLQTALFLMAGSDQVALLQGRSALTAEAKLFKRQILMWDNDVQTSPQHQLLRLSETTRQQLLQGNAQTASYSALFPAHRLNTPYVWDDLILPPATAKHLTELRLWLKHGDTLRDDWQMDKALPAGYKALFYGPPGTGKTLTAALLGKELMQAVYRIDLSQVVSKYIGETEKNLERIFLKAEKNDWILFFDEADALFGKRTQVSSSNDRNANMETGYLLQRIEQCPNLVILASNLKDNIDDAFLRRFQSIVHFTNPDVKERLALWQRGFSAKADVSELSLAALAKEYSLSGAEINNCIRYASLMALEHHSGKIKSDDLVTAIRREKFKSGIYA